jgi:hypothetical protein
LEIAEIIWGIAIAAKMRKSIMPSGGTADFAELIARNGNACEHAQLRLPTRRRGEYRVDIIFVLAAH